MGPGLDWPVFGVDFTSRPNARKPITIAEGRIEGRAFVLHRIEACPDWAGFETWLARPGPWIGGFDFPFGLPREAIVDLGWPRNWRDMVSHCRALGREDFRAVLDRYRESRPYGDRYAHRATDHPAGSHSPLKLVNPPVGLMFLEGTPRLLDAGVTLPGLHSADPQRIGFEAYPGFAARQISRGSYKNDAKVKQTPERERMRSVILAGLIAPDNPFGFTLVADAGLSASLEEDASGDRLDAVLCAMQAAWAWQRREYNFGMPALVDNLEGWIAMVPKR